MSEIPGKIHEKNTNVVRDMTYIKCPCELIMQ